MSASPQPHVSSDRPSLVGRDGELARLHALVSTARTTSQVLVVVGDPGLGKSALVQAARAYAEAAGALVLAAVGVRTESELPVAALHQLLRPVLDGLDSLPPRQASAMRAAFGMEDASVPDRFLVGLACLGLLAEAAETQPVLAVMDDAQTIDRGSLDALTFAARRLQAERVGVIVTSREPETLQSLEHAEWLRLAPLRDKDAETLLDAQGWRVPEVLRRRILTEAAGNPLALLELGAATAAADLRGDPIQPVALPLTTRLERVFADRLRTLPATTRALLTIAAASDGTDLRPVLRAARSAGLGADAFAPAEQAGLVFVQGDTFSCRHPIVRSVVYQSAEPAERRAAHRALATVLEDDPDRRVWHLAAMSDGPDEGVANALEACADRAAARAGYAAAARALDLAAALSPDRWGWARRTVLAAEMAQAAGKGRWVAELAMRLGDAAGDHRLKARMTLVEAYAAVTAGSASPLHWVVPSDLGALVSEQPEIGLTMLTLLAGMTFATDDDDARATAQRAARSIPGSGGEYWRVYALATSDAVGSAAEIRPHLAALRESTASHLPSLRAVALAHWHLDEATHTWSLLDAAVAGTRREGDVSRLPTHLAVQGFAACWSGRWLEARDLAAEATSLAEAVDQPLIVGMARALDASMAALAGEAGAAHVHADRAVAACGQAVVAALAAWARGLAELGHGRHAAAWEHLRELTPEGRSTHRDIVRWAIADLAEVAVRAADRDELAALRVLVERTEQEATASGIGRLRLVAGRALALLAPDDTADIRFGDALAVDGATDWPFELARTRLAHGEWLRRRRRIIDARNALRSALDTFERLGALPWSERARSELRAAGVSIEHRQLAVEQTTPESLTPQQRQIVGLAAEGLTNREIAERLFLSPRTVGFHLYGAYPKLGVSSRAQLARLMSDGVLELR